MVVYRVEKSKVLMGDTSEKDLDFRLSKRSLEFFGNDNIFVMKRGKTLNSFLVFKYRLRSTINTIFEFVNPTLY